MIFVPLQIFDMRRLRGVTRLIADAKPDAHYNGVGQSHNVVANPETKFIYMVGSRKGDYNHCDGT